MTGGNVIPGATIDAPLATDSAEPPEVWEQTHALRALAEFLDRVGQPGLALSINDDRISVQVPSDIGGEQRRRAVVAELAVALGTRSRRQEGHLTGHAWLVADAHLAGHPVHVFTPLGIGDDIDANDTDEASS